MKATKFFYVVALLTSSACSTLKSYTVEEVESKQYLYKSVTYNATIDDLEKRHIEAFKRCGISANWISRKPRSNKAIIVISGTFLDTKVFGAIDFEEINGNVIVDAYTPYPGWREMIDVLLNQLSGSHVCPN